MCCCKSFAQGSLHAAKSSMSCITYHHTQSYPVRPNCIKSVDHDLSLQQLSNSRKRLLNLLWILLNCPIL